MDKQAVRTDRAPAPFQGAPYSQGIVAGDLVFVSGQLGIDPEAGQVVDGGTVVGRRGHGPVLVSVHAAGLSAGRVTPTTSPIGSTGSTTGAAWATASRRAA